MLKRLLAAATLLLAACQPPQVGGGGAVTETAPDAAPPASVVQPLAAGDLAGRLTARGMQPEWRLTIDPAVGLSLEDVSRGAVISADYAAATLDPAGRATIQSGPIRITLENAVCATGEEQGLPWTAHVTVEGGATYTGCAYRRWDNDLAALIPAIDACLSAQPVKLPVAYAARAADGSTLVRLGLAQNRIDCRAPAGAGPVINAPADETLHIASQYDPVFYRAPGENPGGECYAAPEVKDPNGALLGWTDDNAGC